MNLINLTNHPYNLWDDLQKQYAEQYGKVIDYPFPNVRADGSEKEISALADNVYKDVINKFGSNITIHLMGEFTLCYALLRRFQKNNILCIASCTERNTIENPNGEKIVRFEFKRFRRYE